ncbi:MAG: hypothetical protein DDT27_00710 [Dehalococcoidia bacterium]|nr:hypothetical protein [Chloroflexota bacterium]
MSQQDKPDPQPLSAWHIGGLRLTAFAISDAPVKAREWWQVLMGEPPETSITRPRESMQRDEGPYYGGTLINQVQLNRIDWLLNPAPGQGPGDIGFPPSAPFPELLDSFTQLMIRWLDPEVCPALQRLAFGAILYLPVDSRVEGYRQLSAYLPSVVLDVEGSSDFVYRINRPRKSASGISGLKVNRLSKWTVVTSALFEQMIDLSEGSPSSGDFGRTKQSFACQLELDINTQPGLQKPLPQQQLTQVFEELVNLGKEIAVRGDIP